MAFEQAEIRVEKEKEFRELKRAIEEALSPENIKRFLKGLRGDPNSGLQGNACMPHSRFIGITE